MWLLVLHTGNQGGEFFKAWLARSRPQTQSSSNSTNFGSWTWVLELISLMYWQLDSRSNLWNPGKHLQPFEPLENNDEQIDNLHLFFMNRLKKYTRNDARAAKLLPSHSLNIIFSDVHCLCSKPLINLELRWLCLISVVAVRGEGLRQEELNWYY